jgi:hypothetical protein
MFISLSGNYEGLTFTRRYWSNSTSNRKYIPPRYLISTDSGWLCQQVTRWTDEHGLLPSPPRSEQVWGPLWLLFNGYRRLFQEHTAGYECVGLFFHSPIRLHSRVLTEQRENSVTRQANQPNKRLTKGGVRRRRETSSLARSNHSCIRNALLEMINGALN